MPVYIDKKKDPSWWVIKRQVEAQPDKVVYVQPLPKLDPTNHVIFSSSCRHTTIGVADTGPIPVIIDG
jgi:hypothetical protein